MRKGKFSPGGRNPAAGDEALQPQSDAPELTVPEDPLSPEASEPEAPAPELPEEATETTPDEAFDPADGDAEGYDPDLSPEDYLEEEWDDPAPPQTPRRGSRTGTLIFYTLYILFILLFAGTMFLVNSRLKEWLTDYQLSQPTDKRDQVFTELFDAPDWDAVYGTAGLEDTVYEGREAFTAYMSQLVGDQELQWVETSTGLSGNRKYFIKLGQESIASFLLKSEDDPITGLPRWELGGVDVFFRRSESVTVLIQEGQTAFINGIHLDDSHTIRVDSTLAPRYLPAGIYPHRSYTQYLSGLLVEPEVTVLDENGQEITVTYNPESDVYLTEAPAFSDVISEEEQQAVNTALSAYSLYLLGEEDTESLTGHFDRTTDVWQTLLETEPFDQETAVYEYTGETVTGYRQYSEDLFSVRVELRFQSTAPAAEEDEEPETQEHSLEHTLFFLRGEEGWRCVGLTDETVPEAASRVLITFVMDDVVVSDNFYDTALRELVVPIVSAPEGRVFAGWYREETASDGSISLIPVFRPDNTGLVTFSEDFTLEPMTLYALFEDASTETEVTE